MQISEAAAMLRCPYLEDHTQPVRWADLGCGNGVFTHALATLLPAQSTIYAIDKARGFDQTALEQWPVQVHFQQRDFVTDALDLPPLDGLLMANALHYVSDQPAFLQKILRYTRPGAAILIVEYDTHISVEPWVPYPVPFTLLRTLFGELGFDSVEQLAEKPSLYRRDKLYSAWIQT